MKQLLIVFVIVATTTEVPLNGRIFGGKNAAPYQFPFIVAFNDPGQFCDGSIINQKWILTAGHCIDAITSNTTVLIGTQIEHLGGTEYKVLKKIRHEGFDEHTLKHDIGLIQIDGELEFNKSVQPIELGDPEVNATCVAAGWGMTESVSFPKVVQYVELTAIDLNDCRKRSEDFANGLYLGPEQVCTVAPEGKGSCYGDSGGPLICDGKLAGIVSFGVVPCALGYPDVFTRPSAYEDWIQKKIWS